MKTDKNKSQDLTPAFHNDEIKALANEFDNQLRQISSDKEIAFTRELLSMLKVFIAKNHDYGNSFEHTIEVLGIKAGLVPLMNKIDRLISLSDKENLVPESMEDSAGDLANYAVLFKLALKAQSNGAR